MSRNARDRFEDAWMKWAAREPSTSPEQASRELLRRLEVVKKPISPPYRWLALAAILVLSLVAALFRSALFPPTESSVVHQPADALDIPPLREGVVLIWLDSETPLYMTWQPPATEKGDTT